MGGFAVAGVPTISMQTLAGKRCPCCIRVCGVFGYASGVAERLWAVANEIKPDAEGGHQLQAKVGMVSSGRRTMYTWNRGGGLQG